MNSRPQANQLSDALAEVTELSKTRDELTAKTKKLAETTEQLEQRVVDAEQKLKQRDGELDSERKQADDAKHARDDSQAMLERLQNRLESEQERRKAAEQRIVQLLKQPPQADQPRQPSPPHIQPVTRLGRYRDLAAVLGYDPFRDEMFKIMSQEVLVTAGYSDWQERHMLRVTARRRDTAQTLEEQAFAAVMALRWRLIDHPHIRQSSSTAWARIGASRLERDERYAATVTRERIAEMRSRMAELG